DKYDIPLRQTDVSLLVVEGTLNAGQGPTNITLSRTVKINDTAKLKPELHAFVMVEDRNGVSIPFGETGNGNYSNPQLPLVIGQDYRLRIRTGNKEYLSDFVTAKQTPAIDSISWKKADDGLTLYANAHDDGNNTLYYKWNYDETWEIRSYYNAGYQWVGGTTIQAMNYPYPNHFCWKYAKSTNILLGSTAHLQKDVVSEAPLNFIVSGSDKLSVRYSILVRQQALAKPAYEYFQLMKKNTESIGSIFDPQPSELKGNIRCVTNPEEGVIGYVTAATIVEKRKFITAEEANWVYRQDCPFFLVKNHPDSIRLWVPSYLPFDAELGLFGNIIGYYMSDAQCVDCRYRGGDVNRPSYW
ncbi:MAG TPA: DUF4249 domain-containing protein, partial [Flavisolibacter sp.]|nr:DUF4249 domain-containing protein [Flavisolibacter sp.]